MMPTRCTTASAPRVSVVSAAASARSPGTTSTPWGSSVRAWSGLRTSARTACPRRASTVVMCRPTNPLAPVTAISTKRTRSGGRCAALVEEHERAAPRDHRGQCLVDLGIEHRAGKIGRPRHRLFGGHLLLVGARRTEGVEHFGGADDAGADRDLLAAQPVRVARPIPPLVVVAHCRDDVAKVRERREDLGPDDDVLLDVLELVGGEHTP